MKKASKKILGSSSDQSHFDEQCIDSTLSKHGWEGENGREWNNYRKKQKPHRLYGSPDISRNQGPLGPCLTYRFDVLDSRLKVMTGTKRSLIVVQVLLIDVILNIIGWRRR